MTPPVCEATTQTKARRRGLQSVNLMPKQKRMRTNGPRRACWPSRVANSPSLAHLSAAGMRSGRGEGRGPSHNASRPRSVQVWQQVAAHPGARHDSTGDLISKFTVGKHNSKNRLTSMQPCTPWGSQPPQHRVGSTQAPTFTGAATNIHTDIAASFGPMCHLMHCTAPHTLVYPTAGLMLVQRASAAPTGHSMQAWDAPRTPYVKLCLCYKMRAKPFLPWQYTPAVHACSAVRCRGLAHCMHSSMESTLRRVASHRTMSHHSMTRHTMSHVT